MFRQYTIEIYNTSSQPNYTEEKVRTTFFSMRHHQL